MVTPTIKPSMKRTKIYKYVLLTADILFIPGLFFLKWLSGVMLSNPRPCPWTLFGGQCVTCGGTRFVHSLLSGRFLDAFGYNQFLFIVGGLLLFAFIVLHFHIFRESKATKQILATFFSIPSLIVVCIGMVVFLIWRNLPVFAEIAARL